MEGHTVSFPFSPGMILSIALAHQQRQALVTTVRNSFPGMVMNLATEPNGGPYDPHGPQE